MVIIKKIIFLFVFSILVAIPSFSGNIKFTQPNGDEFFGFVKGDEWQNWHETKDGYKIARDNLDNWKFVKSYNKSVPVLTDLNANENPPLGLNKNIYPERINHNIDYKENAFNILTDREIWNFPLLLIDFPDMESSYSIEIIDALLNESGYSGVQGQTGSFRDFYLEISYGQFDAQTQVMGWYTSAEDHIYYGDDTPGSHNNVREMIGDAIDDAEAQGVDWSQYDNDGNGYVDGINIIHAGQGAEEGDGSNIWSHKWSLGGYARYYDGVWIDSYSINPEKQNAGYSGIPGLTHIGVISHEFGHAMGLPDLYDTDYSSSGIGTWGLMSGGSWGGNGSSPWYPAHMCAWAKIEMGWINPIILDDEISITLQLDNVEENAVAFRLNGPSYTNQYFLFENRQKIGSDQTLKNSGLLIWHINDSQSNNSNDYNRLVDLEQADGLFQLNDGGNDGDLSDPYPGTMNITRFADETMPSSQYNNGSTSNIIVNDILEENEIIIATFQNMPSLSISNINSIELIGDNDGIVNPDESFITFFQLDNPSTMNISNVNVIISSESEYLSLMNTVISVGNINGNSSSTTIEISGNLALNTPPGIIPILIEIVGEIEGGDVSQFLTLNLDVSLNQRGFPVEEYGAVKGSPVIIDLDNDGQNEIIFGTMDGYLVALNEDGSIQNGNWPLNIGGQFWASPAVEDIDNDGELEIIISNHNKHLYIVDSFGNIDVEYFTNQFLVGTPTIGNFDSDTNLEIAFSGISQNSKLFVINSDTTWVDGFPLEINQHVFSGVSVADFNGNDLDDIVMGTNDGNLYLIYDNGQIAPGFPVQTGGGIKSDPIIADIIGDSNFEILFGNDNGNFICLNSNGEVQFNLDVSGPIKTSPAIIEHNNSIKIFFGTIEGTLYGISPLGNDLIGWPKFYNQDIYVSPIFSDLNNDGSPEIISATKTGEYIINDLYGIPFYEEPLITGIITESQSTIFDLDNDGDLEIFIGNQNGLTGLDIKYQGQLNDWNMFKGNYRRTGFNEISSSSPYLGDTNLDGIINVLDILLLLNHILYGTGLSELGIVNADFNNDELINVSDIVLIVQLILNDF